MPELDSQPSSPYQLTTAKLIWRQGDVPEASDFGDIYFSTEQGLAETRYVFLQHNQLEQRWLQLAADQLFCIGETGFGTGLNFLAAWQLWQKTAPSTARLHFISVEKYPLTKPDLQRALTAWPELNLQAQQLLDQYPLPVPGHHLLNFDNHRVNLHLIFGDAAEGLEQLRSSHHPNWQSPNTASVDAWFLDGFAPAKNPELWNEKLFSLIADLSSKGTTLATFTAAGTVRRSLTAQGFSIKKAKGYRKREMLWGEFSGQPAPTEAVKMKGVKAPWYVNPHILSSNRTTKAKRVAIIGGGLAGATSAYAMANRGWQVSLIERMPQLAQAASGNSQGMLYTKLSPEAGTLNQFTLSSYLHALRFYQQLRSADILSTQQMDFCGVLQLATNDKELKLYRQLQQVFAQQQQLVKFVDAAKASSIAGIELDHPGCFFPQAGWVSPPQLCNALASHPNIETHFNCEITELAYEQQWQLSSSQDKSFSADAVIIANSRDAEYFSQTTCLPLKTIRGQITQLESSPASSALKTVICHEGYITPAINQHHSLGATFDNNDTSTELRSADHLRNLHSLQKAIPSLSSTIEPLDPLELTGRAGLRCTSPDYLPIVGPVPQRQDFLNDYAELKKDAKSNITSAGKYYPDLYINVGHGSRGLTSTPICSELIASMINREPAPLPRKLITALNPARFTIRDMIRNKI